MASNQWLAVRARIARNALSIGGAVAVYGVSFGALGVTSGLSVGQTCALSVIMFTGASQFAFVGVVGAGGSAIAAIAAAWLLGLRNAMYALRMSTLLDVGGVRKLLAAQLTIDESTALALAQDEEIESGRATRLGFWSGGLSVYVLWNAATLLGAVGAGALGDPRVYGLDAAIPAGLFALLWPRLRDREAWAVAGAAMCVAALLTPMTRPGIPVIATGLVAVVAALRALRRGAA
ncbi:MAG: AzlC family ABC transporter permease [Actinomycetes bacterium]